MDPREVEQIVIQSEVIRFRLTRAEKAQIEHAAQRCATSVSALLRRTARAAASGRQPDRHVLTDFAAVRRTANHLLSLSENSSVIPEQIAREMRDAAAELREIVARHLDNRP